ncbi:MAG: glycosyltransferase [Prevotellaceae bacterium]|jgi:cellulose synthase/poly-beta-1,6-N-acetylglucosamine synthase-like glycosyltransferase|nr:glycosyltransferase [Prevotellaceae bacterium]
MSGIITAVICLAYLLLIIIFIKGWHSIADDTNAASTIDSPVSLSVVVPCRNEAENLPRLLHALKKQTFRHFEAVLVDDHSSDDTYGIMTRSQADFKKTIILKSQHEGKKQALAAGILATSGNFIVTTDADCLPSEKWLESLVACQSKHDPDLIIGPVNLTAGNSVFQRLQQVEFVSLIASGAGASGMKMPIMCNGANLAFKKSVWLKNKDHLHHEMLSGDDVFLLHRLKKQKGNIVFLKSEDAMVFTKAASSVSDFIKQRRRWASKTTSYSDWQSIFTAVVIFLMSLFQLCLFVYSLFCPAYWFVFAFLFLFKWTVDYKLLSTVKDFFHLKKLPYTSFVLSLIYPFYIVFTAILSFFPQREW